MQKTSDLIWQDTQHQALFELIDKIKEVPFDPDILIQLKLYAEHHFVLEETYMLELGYPHKDEHIEAHDRFRAKPTTASGKNLRQCWKPIQPWARRCRSRFPIFFSNG
jgi:hemerythrin-like metal-binding protein